VYSLTNSPEWLYGGLWYFQQIKLLLGKKKPALYYAWGDEYYDNPKK
jgi:hypothetical protein